MKKWNMLPVFLLAFCLSGAFGPAVLAEEAEEELEYEISDADWDEEGASFEEIEVEPYDPLEYITLGEYKGLEVEQLIADISDEDVEAEIAALLEENAEVVEKDGAAEEGDSVSFSYVAEVDGEELESSEGEALEIVLGYMDFGEEIDAALTGAKAGDTITADVLLDDLYGEEYDGKTAVYTMKVEKVFNYVEPELDDEFVAAHTSYDSVDAYRTGLKDELLSYTETSNRQEAGESALSLAVDNAEMNGYPEDLFQYQYNSLLEMYYMYFGDSYTDLVSEEDLVETAEMEVKSEMVLKAIIEAEGLELTEEAFQEAMEKEVESFDDTFSSVEEMVDYYGKDQLWDYVQRQKVCEWLLDHAVITELTQEEYDELYGDDEYLDFEDDEDYDDYEDYDDEDWEEWEEEDNGEQAAEDSGEDAVE